MKRMILPTALALAAAMSLESPGQQPADRQSSDQAEVTLTPEMWYYKQQMERYDDPKIAVRRNAEFRAQQRMARLEVLKWYGFSNARPTVSPTPFTSMYSPAWQSNDLRPFAWYTAGRPTVIVSPRREQ